MESNMIKAKDVLLVGIGILTAAVVAVAMGAFLVARVHRTVTGGIRREKALSTKRTHLPTRASRPHETNSLPSRAG